VGVTVYPRLGALLAERHLSVSALEREIEARYGLPVDPKTLYRLTQGAPVQRADLEIAGAAAAVLGVGLDDLFQVEATPLGAPLPAVEGDLPPDQAARLSVLFGLQAQRLLTDAEREEVATLVGEYGRRRHEAFVHRYAARHGLTEEEARRAIETEVAEADRWWKALEADPARRRSLIQRAKRQRSRQASVPDDAGSAPDHVTDPPTAGG